MDEEETPSKRITRDIQPNQEFLDDFPSFSLGLTQDFQEISGSIAKSQINQQEGMSKSGNTPLKMKEVMHVAKSKRKTKKLDKHKEDKSVDVLTSKKKSKVKEIASTSNKQDKSVDVLISKKKRKGKDIAYTSNKENAQSDSVEQLHFGRIEVEGSSANAIMIYINGTPLRFTRRDFCLVSRLKCSDDLLEFVFNTEKPNRLLQMYFSEKKSVSKAKFAQSFNSKVWGDNVDDALKFGILYFIHSYILSEEPFSTTIERIDFDLVESRMYIDYPWGNKAFEELTKNINGKMKKIEKYYKIYVNDMPRQPHGSLDCGLYISAYAEFLSDGNGISTGPFDPDFMRSRYATLL
ncbi:hypothetical protein H5410_001303 [Solanum commersonii]|uniref:DUF1985 domain-containing protein n=1 Tax=Solanum commersonii TaxID=4109 RepID=A0A9J6AZ63_SOLCO|nr:hypothetical protein H5410_001303 [Solanum commersonii]